jgi:hypothetical protein
VWNNSEKSGLNQGRLRNPLPQNREDSERISRERVVMVKIEKHVDGRTLGFPEKVDGNGSHQLLYTIHQQKKFLLIMIILPSQAMKLCLIIFENKFYL